MLNYQQGYFRKSEKGERTAYTRNLGGGGGGNTKTHVAVHVYEEGLFDLRGATLFKGGQMPPLASPP